MSEHRSEAEALADHAQRAAGTVVLGLREPWLQVAVAAAVGSAGFALVDAVVSTAELLQVVADRRPGLVIATLDVLGAEPAHTIRRMLVDEPGVAVVVLLELDTLPVWLLEAGASAVVRQDDIGELKRVLRNLRER